MTQAIVPAMFKVLGWQLRGRVLGRVLHARALAVMKRSALHLPGDAALTYHGGIECY